MSGLNPSDIINTFPHLFSYWLVIWFICYELGWTIYNPFVWFAFASIYICIQILVLIYYKFDPINILLDFIINMFIKILPLWILRHSKVQWVDIKAGFILFAIYILYMEWNNLLIPFMSDYLFFNIKKQKLNEKKLDTPIIHILRKLFHNIF